MLNECQCKGNWRWHCFSVLNLKQCIIITDKVCLIPGVGPVFDPCDVMANDQPAGEWWRVGSGGREEGREEKEEGSASVPWTPLNLKLWGFVYIILTTWGVIEQHVVAPLALVPLHFVNTRDHTRGPLYNQDRAISPPSPHPGPLLQNCMYKLSYLKITPDISDIKRRGFTSKNNALM